MIPKHIYQKLKEENETTETLTDVIILFADIVGFTQWSSDKNPQAVIEMLSHLFVKFDKLCVKYNIYKVHTIGDCYVAIGYQNEIKDCLNECINMIDFA
jgi:phospholipid-translocating ATPase